MYLRLGRPGGDLLSHVLGRSTIGAEGFHGRVRDGIGCGSLAMTTRPAKAQRMSCSRWAVAVGLEALSLWLTAWR